MQMDGDRDYGHWLGLALIWALALAGLSLASWMLTEFGPLSGFGPGRPFTFRP